MSEADQEQGMDSEVYVKQEDGTLKAVELPRGLAERAKHYRLLGEMGFSHDQIRFIWHEGRGWGG